MTMKPVVVLAVLSQFKFDTISVAMADQKITNATTSMLNIYQHRHELFNAY